MNSLELKGGILQMIATIDDKAVLEELKELITSFAEHHAQEGDFWNELSDFEKSELDEAIEESKHEENLVPHEEVMKKYSKWLDK